MAGDARLDLAGAAFRLAGDAEAPRNPFSDAMARTLAPLAASDAARLAGELRKTGFGLHAAAQYAAYLSTGPDFTERFPAPEFFATLAGGKERLGAWRAALSALAREPAYRAWEKDTAAERERFVSLVAKAQDGKDLGKPLAALLGGRSWEGWTVAVSGLYPNGGGASWVLEEKPGRPDVFVAYGPYWDKKKGAWGGTPALFAIGAAPEAAFTMAYAAYELCRPALAADAPPCAGFAGIDSGEDCYERHWVQAVVARLLKDGYGAAAEREYRSQRPPTKADAAVAAAFAASLKDRARRPDLVSATAELAAPLRGGAAPACRLVDRSRFAETVYARRLRYYLEARLEARPDAELGAVLEQLRYLEARR